MLSERHFLNSIAFLSLINVSGVWDFHRPKIKKKLKSASEVQPLFTAV